MFYRIKIRDADIPSQRLLWRDGDSTKEPDVYKMTAMIFGAKSSPSSASFVKNKNAEIFSKKFPEAADSIIHNMYVDDYIHSVQTIEEAVKRRQEVSQICESGGFVIRKWISNSPEVIASIPSEIRADGLKDLEEHSELPCERVLGMWWDPNQDCFTFKINLHKVPQEVLEGRRPTKRELCSLIMSLFDPLGFINHYKIKGMMMLQDTWRSGIGWDDEVPTSTYTAWIKWLKKLGEITLVRIPRIYARNINEAISVELHTFVDSSSESFCAVCYLRVEFESEIVTAFVTSKVRVAPLKKQTIPRLELQAALLGSRIANAVQSELEFKITRRRFWSDSKTVLQWIRSMAILYKEYVPNRVGEIQETTESHEWGWVPTALNVADVATRFTSEISFEPDDWWYHGPQFLLRPKEEWPQEKTSDGGVCATTTIQEMQVGPQETSIEDSSVSQTVIPEVTRFSSFLRLLRATAAVKSCATKWISSVKNRRTPEGINITATDIMDAEQRILQLAQNEAFEVEINCLKSGKPISKKSSIYKLSPVLVDGLLRVKGRIGAAAVAEETKLPVILPSRHHVTDLLIDQTHQQCAHQGKETVLAELRQKFWITDGRQAVKRAFTRCRQCQLRKAKPVIPEMGNLPHHRLASNQPPFTFTGLDCFGPMEVVVGRRREKRWGVIFCCMVTRAVHLEIVHGMSTDEMLMAVSRFVDTTGRPQLLISDNGTNFVGASNEMKKSMNGIDFKEISRHGKFHPIQWKFNPPAAPHMGGAWERLIQSVKKCMIVILKEKTPKDTTLLTTLKAVENILNSRPLTYISSDPDDPAPLTPNHLLRGGIDVGPSIPATIDESSDFLRSQWRRTQLFVDQFWRRWTTEYLPKLLRRDKWLEQTKPIQRGDLVFVVDDTLPRNLWRRGVITQTGWASTSCGSWNGGPHWKAVMSS